MKINKVHCFFEQSGTFKNEFIKLGITAEDYDIQNNFGVTDNVIDLFREIEKGYMNAASIFDNIQKEDLIIAFFPCIYFCENNQLYFTGKHQNLSNLSAIDKTNIIIDRANERNYFYTILLKLFAICEIKKIKLIVENPYTAPHYLTENFLYKPSVIDKDRTRRGDFFKKPTQYWFVNCEPTFGYSFCAAKEKKTVHNSKRGKGGICSEERSLISSDYAHNFICDYILGKQQKNSELTLFDIENK